jgi:hypothetical protein
MTEMESAEAGSVSNSKGKSIWLWRWNKYWPDLRALCVLFHVLTLLALGFPAPAGVTNRSHWKDPSVKDELHTAATRARSLGIELSDAEFEELIFQVAKKYNSFRKVFTAPFKPYAKYCGVRQSWRMFSAPHRYPTIFSVDVSENGKWRPVYEARSEEYTWMRERFDHHRMRRILFLHGWKKYRRSYRGFSQWLGTQAIRDFPEAQRIRIQQLKKKSRSPEDMRAGKTHRGKIQNRRVVKLKRPKP